MRVLMLSVLSVVAMAGLAEAHTVKQADGSYKTCKIEAKVTPKPKPKVVIVQATPADTKSKSLYGNIYDSIYGNYEEEAKEYGCTEKERVVLPLYGKGYCRARYEAPVQSPGDSGGSSGDAGGAGAGGGGTGGGSGGGGGNGNGGGGSCK